MRRISLCAPESNETYEGIKRFPSSTVDPVSDGSVVPRCPAADRWIWVYATRVREAVQGTRHVCRHSSRDGCARSAPDGMVDHTHRTRRRLRCTARGTRDDCQRAHGRCVTGGHVLSAPAVWVQLDQAPRGDAG